MVADLARRRLAAEIQLLEVLRRNSGEDQGGMGCKPEAGIVGGIAQDDASTRVPLPEIIRPGLDQPPSDPLPPVLALHRYWPEAEPARGTASDRHGRECDVPNDGSILDRHERDSEGSILSEGIDDTGFRSVAMDKISEGGCYEVTDSLRVAGILWSDEHASHIAVQRNSANRPKAGMGGKRL